MNNAKNIIVISAPSGGGKSVVSKYILANFPEFKFSISTTTRTKRSDEADGEHYHFVTKDEFLKKVKNDEFVEYEEIFGNYYGTLKSEVETALLNSEKLLFDIDVKGAYSIKKYYPNNAILIFLNPPSIEILENRLRNRQTETEEQVKKRIARAKMEIEMSQNFDYIILNDNLNDALREIDKIIKKYS